MGLMAVGSALLAVGTELANHSDCCVGCCPADTAEEVLDIIQSNAASVSVTVPSDSILTGGSCSGDCTNLAGSYTLPFLSYAGGILQYADTFSADLCSSSGSETYTVSLRVTALESMAGVTLVYILRVAASISIFEYNLNYTIQMPCQQVFDTPHGLNPVDGDPSGGTCYTQTGTGSQATVTL